MLSFIPRSIKAIFLQNIHFIIKLYTSLGLFECLYGDIVVSSCLSWAVSDYTLFVVLGLGATACAPGYCCQCSCLGSERGLCRRGTAAFAASVFPCIDLLSLHLSRSLQQKAKGTASATKVKNLVTDLYFCWLCPHLGTPQSAFLASLAALLRITAVSEYPCCEHTASAVVGAAPPAREKRTSGVLLRRRIGAFFVKKTVAARKQTVGRGPGGEAPWLKCWL